MVKQVLRSCLSAASFQSTRQEANMDPVGQKPGKAELSENSQKRPQSRSVVTRSLCKERRDVSL